MATIWLDKAGDPFKPPVKGKMSLCARPFVGSILLKMGQSGWAQPPGTATPHTCRHLPRLPGAEDAPAPEPCLQRQVGSCPEPRKSLQSVLGPEGGPREPFSGQTGCEGPRGPPALTALPGQTRGCLGRLHRAPPAWAPAQHWCAQRSGDTCPSAEGRTEAPQGLLQGPSTRVAAGACWCSLLMEQQAWC